MSHHANPFFLWAGIKRELLNNLSSCYKICCKKWHVIQWQFIWRALYVAYQKHSFTRVFRISWVFICPVSVADNRNEGVFAYFFKICFEIWFSRIRLFIFLFDRIRENRETMTDEVEILAESLKDLVQEGMIKIAWTNDGNTKYILVNPKESFK